jgi:hypothetical protein
MKAFPEVNYVKPLGNGQSVMTISGGMDLRDYFAAQALPELVKIDSDAFPELDYSDIAEISYKYADAMMEARNK